MSDINLEQAMTMIAIILSIQFLCFIVFLIAKKQLSKSRFLRFIGILLIGMTASLIPLGPLSVTIGFPAVLITSILVSCLLDKDIKV